MNRFAFLLVAAVLLSAVSAGATQQGQSALRKLEDDGHLRETGAGRISRFQRRVERQARRQAERVLERQRPSPASAARAARVPDKRGRLLRRSAGVVPSPSPPPSAAGSARDGKRCRPVRSGRSSTKASWASSVYLEAGGDFEPRVFEHLRAPAPAPCHDSLVPRPQQRRDLRQKEPDHRADPAVQHRGRLHVRRQRSDRASGSHRRRDTRSPR